MADYRRASSARYRNLLVRSAAILALSAASGLDAQHTGPQGDIVVQGKRDTGEIDAGRWKLDLTRSYFSGRDGIPRIAANAGGTPARSRTDGSDVLSDETRAMGKDQSFSFCMLDTQLTSLIRILVGEGQSGVSGTESCSAITATVANGRISATQNCGGGHLVSRGRTMPSRSNLRMSGRYTRTTFTLDFTDRWEPVTYDPTYASDPSERRWTIRGKRVGVCGAGS